MSARLPTKHVYETIRQDCCALRAILLASPGADRYRIAQKICDKFNFKHISLKSVLKKHLASNTELGKILLSYIKKGTPFPEEGLLHILEREIKKVRNSWWLVSEFACTKSFAEKFWKHSKLDIAIEVQYPSDVLIKNLKAKYCNKEKITSKESMDAIKRINAVLEYYSTINQESRMFYEEKGILKTFYSNDYEEMWIKIKEDLQDHIDKIRKAKADKKDTM